MTDREQAIATLTEHLTHWKRLLSEGVCTKDEGEKTINALSFAIKTLEQESVIDMILKCLSIGGISQKQKVRNDMADIELVIKISEKVYESCKKEFKNLGENELIDEYEYAIANGTPLPKGHGDLIDRKALVDNGINKGFCDWYDEIKHADAIIEADRKEQE